MKGCKHPIVVLYSAWATTISCLVALHEPNFLSKWAFQVDMSDLAEQRQFWNTFSLPELGWIEKENNCSELTRKFSEFFFRNQVVDASWPAAAFSVGGKGKFPKSLMVVEVPNFTIAMV